VVTAGGSVLLSSRGGLLGDAAFREHAFGTADRVSATLAHGQRPAAAGWHVMRMPGTDWTETGSGLGAGGAQVLLVHVTGAAVTGQRLLPVVQVSADRATRERLPGDLDAVLTGGVAGQASGLADVLVAVASGRQVPRVFETGNVGFQVTRGLLGTSM
jgi:altronate dehydratase